MAREWWEKDEGLRRRILLDLIRERSMREREVTLSSGAESCIYFDMKAAFSRPNFLECAASLIFEEVKNDPPDCFFGPEGALALLSATAFAYVRRMPWGLPFYYYRRSPKDHGVAPAILGTCDYDHLEGLEATLIDDVATSGDTLYSAIRLAEDHGLHIRNAIVIIDRGEGAVEKLRAYDVTLTSIFTMADFDL